jgi:hypothetical protein
MQSLDCSTLQTKSRSAEMQKCSLKGSQISMKTLELECHITVNGIPECQAPIYQMHKDAGNSARVMCDSATACGYGTEKEKAEVDAAKLRRAFPDADIQVADGPCHSDPWWKTEAGLEAAAILAE